MSEFWSGRRVFLTGHTGFKGSWLCLWLNRLGAQVTGYALSPPTDPCLYELARIDELIESHIADVRDGESLARTMADARPEIVIHMAAQPLVRDSYEFPVGTYATNVMGSVNLLEAVRHTRSVKAVVNVTTDKCYENKEWAWGYRENEPLGGYDPYSSSKACSELVTGAYRNSYFNPLLYAEHGVALASARAGNVIGGGDWAKDRLIPDLIRAFLTGDTVCIRNPHAIRPWQHVLEPLYGYLMLAQQLHEDGIDFAEAWNFGPQDADVKTVEWIMGRFSTLWGNGFHYQIDKGYHPHEANHLKLDCSKTNTRLGWHPRWNLSTAIDAIAEWTQAYQEGADMRTICLEQIDRYEKITLE